MEFVLASESARRVEILSMLGLKFNTYRHKFKEPKIKNHPVPEKFVEELAIKKAESVAYELKDKVIITADTIVVLKNEIIGKPKDVADAIEILKKLSGTKHKVYTGVCIYYPLKKILVSDVEVSVVYTNKLSIEEIKKFAGKHLDKAGAYAVQQKDDRFVRKIVGDYYNVVGFPVVLFLELYKKFWQRLLRQQNLI
ncbi:MAG: Maf family protein [Endomicrobia bacterium]|nr:Maf family protein [Endomicrobiia bacterium]MCX7940156.1 Maf family protein [Endomicrobiia bacterium]MDW8056106.1 Maf family protein [Elusimicrobiota bacterium]